MTEQLENYRKQIDAVDGQLIELLEKRFDVVALINDYKKEHGLKVLDSSREEQVLAKVVAQTKDEDKAKYLKEIFKEIMHQSRNWQHENRKEQ